MKLAILGALVASAACALGVPAVRAAEYPTRTITVVVPYSAGGPTDTVARLVAQGMSKALGQQVIVENVTGAGGTLGARRVASADPDGYTILVHHIGQATAPLLYPGAGYDPETAFAPVGLIADVPMTVVSRPGFEPKTLQELIALLREKGDRITYANAGLGTASHLCGMLLMKIADVKPTTVPYQGTGPAMIDVIGGQVDFMCDQTTNTTGPIRSGKVKAYATTTAERLPTLPDIPSAPEAGMPKLDLAIWHGLYTPKGVKPEIRAKLEQALRTALHDPSITKRFQELGALIVPDDQMNGQALATKLGSEVRRWRQVTEQSAAYAN